MQGVTTSQPRRRRVRWALAIASGAVVGCAQIAGFGNFKDAPDAGTGGGTSSSGSGGGGGAAPGCATDPTLSGVQVVTAAPGDDITGFALDTVLGTATAIFWMVRGSTINDGVVYRTTLGNPMQTTVVVKNQCIPRAMVADDTGVYWVNENADSCPQEAGGGQVWAAGLDGSNAGYLFAGEHGPLAIAASGSNLYWLNDGDSTLRSGPKTGGTAKTLYMMTTQPRALATDGTSIYWTELGPPPSVWRGDTGGTPATMVATMSKTPLWLTLFPLNGGAPYWTDSNAGTVTYLVDGGATPLAMGKSPAGITLDFFHAYWADTGAGVVLDTPVNGGQSVSLAPNQCNPTEVAIDLKNVFWLNHSGGKGTGIWRTSR
jgi:hypothetical protein